MLLLGDCLEQMKTLEANSVDAVVTDPPYGLSFMGKRWDYDVPSVDIWREVFRVLKPGGHVLSFGGTRTYHRMVVNIEDAGFDVRDAILWHYGSGFPKSHNVSKAIDKMKGTINLEPTGETCPDIRANNYSNSEGKERLEIMKSVATSPEAKQWDGWGSALKPATEIICLARKPLEKSLTLADNVLKYGTGAINIDGCRIEVDSRPLRLRSEQYRPENFDIPSGSIAMGTTSQGRWPANVLFGCACEPSPHVYPDGSTEFQHDDDCAVKMLDAQSGHLKSGKHTEKEKDRKAKGMFAGGIATDSNWFGDSGGASRFFKVIKQEEPCRFRYQAKASKSERNAGLDCSFLVWENDAWEKQDLKSALAVMLELARVTSADILADDSSWSTDIYGHSISAQYPKGTTFTISTVLKTITELKTLSASQSLNTKESIQNAIKTIEASGLNLAESVSFINQLELNTTNEKTAYLLGVVRVALPTLLQIKGFAKTNNFHSTVKPIKLMEYLITLITPPNGTVLDPFMGSGSTGVAAKNLGRKFIGIERDQDYYEIAKRRIEA